MSLANDKRLDVAVSASGGGGQNPFSIGQKKYGCTNFYKVEIFENSDNVRDEAYGLYGYTDIATATGADLTWLNSFPAGTTWKVRPNPDGTGVAQARKYVKRTRAGATGTFAANWHAVY